MSTLLQFYFEPDNERTPSSGVVMDAPKTVDWDTVFKRQRAIQGVCGKTQPDFSEQWIQQMSHSTAAKVRSIQKTKANSTEIGHSQEVPANDWLDSPNATAEAQLHRLDSAHPKTPHLHTKRNEWIQWKAASPSVALFGESLGNSGKDHSAFQCQIPNLQPEIGFQEKFRRLIATPVSARWPQACEKMCREASTQIRQLTDHLEHLGNSGCNLIALCSHKPGCGCTTILLVCAREISHRGLKTLLIDGNFSHPSLAEAFQLSPTSGWGALLEENNAETMLWSLEENLDLLPLNTVSAKRTKNLLQNAWFSDWTDVFRNHYDLVLIDSGSLSEQEKHAQLKQLGADGVFLIVDNFEKSRNSLLSLRRSLSQHEIAFFGFAENHVR